MGTQPGCVEAYSESVVGTQLGCVEAYNESVVGVYSLAVWRLTMSL